MIPRAALWLGAVGTTPLLLGAAAVALGPDWLQATVYFHLTNYAALVLAFLGAVNWGFAASGGARGAWYAAAAAPLAIGWVSLAAIYPPLRTSLLVAGFAVAFAVDLRAAKTGLAPPWYLRLRKPLTAAALVSLGVVAVTAA